MKLPALFAFLLLTAITLIPASAAAFDYQASDDGMYFEGNHLYVWAANGVHLRRDANDAAPIIAKLNYGTEVTVAKQDASPNFYDYTLIETVKPDDEQDKKTQKIVLKGVCLKVKTAQQEGYVFNKLLLNIPPMLSAKNAAQNGINESEQAISYFKKVFNLSSKTTKKAKEPPDFDARKYVDSSHAKTNSAMHEEYLNSHDGGFYDGVNMIIPNMSFDAGIVFFTALWAAAEIEETKENEYVLYTKSNGNCAETGSKVEKQKKGVAFEWYCSAD